jgi:hypothetical protein
VKSAPRSLLLLVLLSALCACAGRSPGFGDAAEAGPVGLYRARLEHPDGSSDRFKLLLYAALPDRLHGEVLAPVGGTVLIFDGGEGRMAVTFVRDRVSYVGPASPGNMEKLIAIPLELEALVRALLEGEEVGGGLAVVREPDGEGLPRRLELFSGDRGLRLELKRYRPLRAPAEALGTGRPPDGMEVHPLEQLEPIEYVAEGARRGDS